MHSLCLLLALAASVQSLAVTVPKSHIQHEKRDALSSAWVKRDKVSSGTLLPMRIGLKQRDLHLGEEFLMDMSHPSSKNYGKHWTASEVIEAFAPSQETVDTIRDWLIKSGVSHDRITHSDNKGWLAFDATAEEAGRLLHTEYYDFEHTETGHVTPACDSYHVPQPIQDHLDYVVPGIRLIAPRGGQNMRKRALDKLAPRSFGVKTVASNSNPSLKLPNGNSSLSTCDVVITPECIRALYNITEPDPNSVPRADNSLGIFEHGDYYAQEDLDLFFANFTPKIPKGTGPTPAFIDGASAPVPVADAGGESDLDFELAYPIIYPQTITLYQTDDTHYDFRGPPGNGYFNTFLDAIDGSYCSYIDPLDPTYPDNSTGGYNGTLQCGVYKPTNVISFSYGFAEADLPAAYQIRQCNEYMKLGLQGVSIFFASGDSGVASSEFYNIGCLGPNSTVFSPDFPAACPWVTSVGATKVYAGKTVNDPESAANDLPGHPYLGSFSTGGGFSNIYSIPAYQNNSVATYFEDHDPGYPFYSGNVSYGAGLYNRLGRGYPDVAANGDNIGTFIEGSFQSTGGTSASAPIFASIVNRLNEARLNANKSTIGFINPALYANPEMLNDITNGTNPGCRTPGFSAVRGWDPVTGLGTPDFGRMMDYFMSLP